MTYRVIQGDAQALPLDDESVDAIICDPPYELGFMGKDWDSAGVAYSVDTWTEALRVAKPGAHLLAFGGTRTYHRMTCAIEDAGWEIRNCVMWVFGSGFPKSHNISKAIDRKRYDRSQILEVTGWIAEARDAAGLTNSDLDAAFGFAGMAGHWTSQKSQPTVPTLEQIPQLLEVLGDPEVPEHIAELIWTLNGRKGQPGPNWAKREKAGDSFTLFGRKSGIGNDTDGHHTVGGTTAAAYDITSPATDAARQWEGWGTSLKPAYEPVVMARKPFAGTVASNVQTHGTGALNIDASRIGSDPGYNYPNGPGGNSFTVGGDPDGTRSKPVESNGGRWPANLILDPEAAAMLDATVGVKTVSRSGGNSGTTFAAGVPGQPRDDARGGHNDSGGPSRFFYTAKTSRKEREAGLEEFVKADRPGVGALRDGESRTNDQKTAPRANDHPTVKPRALMRYLATLVTPPGGLVLDPFMGSGSTGLGVMDAGFRFVGVEMDAHYCDIARARLEHAYVEAHTDAEKRWTREGDCGW